MHRHDVLLPIITREWKSVATSMTSANLNEVSGKRSTKHVNVEGHAERRRSLIDHED